MSLTEAKIQDLVSRMEQRYITGNDCATGIFRDMEHSIEAVRQAQKQYATMSMDTRKQVVAAMRRAAMDAAEALAREAVEETGFGRIQDKLAKNRLAVEKTPGVEDLKAKAFTGDWGMTLTEQAPYGVIGAITPSTNPTATIINNAIGMVAAGNGVVFNPHPGAKRCSNHTVSLLNEAITSVSGIQNLLGSVDAPSPDTAQTLFNSKHVRLMVATGGEGVVNASMRSGKKTIGAGPGNPPVIVDDTADLPKAARDIVDGASFDNNILCIAEKEVFVFHSMADRLIEEMKKHGAYLLPQNRIPELASAVLQKTDGRYTPNKAYIGKNAGDILSVCGITPTQEVRLIICEVEKTHPFVTTELLMPVLPITRVGGLSEAVESALQAENDCRHTAIMHSQSVSNLTVVARALDTTIFVKNAPSYAGLGLRGEGYTTLTIATPTGEGLTSAKNFVRSRRCTLSEGFRII